MPLRPLLALIALIALPSAAAAAEQIMCCDDPSGHRICGNPLPNQCYGRAYKELTPGGRTTRQIEAPLTPEQRVVRNAEEKARLDAEAKVIERRRRDKALLESYASVQAIEERRDLSLGAAGKELEILRRRESVLAAERKQQDASLAALKGRPAPRALKEDIAATASELDALRRVIGQKQREFDTMQSRFAEDRLRYLELTLQSAPH